MSSRTPGGLPSRCTLCGAEHALEFSDPADDAPCPSCGHLLWRSAQALAALQHRFAETGANDGEPGRRVTADVPLLDLAADSLDMVELVMELESELQVAIPFHDAERMHTLGDVIRYAEERRREA